MIRALRRWPLQEGVLRESIHGSAPSHCSSTGEVALIRDAALQDVHPFRVLGRALIDFARQSEKGNPRLDTLAAVLAAFGLRLSVQPMQKLRTRHGE